VIDKEIEPSQSGGVIELYAGVAGEKQKLRQVPIYPHSRPRLLPAPGLVGTAPRLGKIAK
jgi:hypothetical protein